MPCLGSAARDFDSVVENDLSLLIIMERMNCNEEPLDLVRIFESKETMSQKEAAERKGSLFQIRRRCKGSRRNASIAIQNTIRRFGTEGSWAGESGGGAVETDDKSRPRRRDVTIQHKFNIDAGRPRPIVKRCGTKMDRSTGVSTSVVAFRPVSESSGRPLSPYHPITPSIRYNYDIEEASNTLATPLKLRVSTCGDGRMLYEDLHARLTFKNAIKKDS
ncbi:hypothetical protein EVAR_49917_1 [Eumeta japonica]|uniref:Uncharacterized protein n=1 Tax=Eumeta variegata TaxID=151549 RepID=A0A4C1Y5J9_EUMVA|nr:hypothetical protein EVAR_49917_1 [Eumeta japonica]